MTSMTVGKDRIDLLQDRIEALEKKLADQERAKDVQDNFGWVYGVPMTDGLGNHSIIKPIPNFTPEMRGPDWNGSTHIGAVTITPLGPAQSRTETE